VSRCSVTGSNRPRHPCRHSGACCTAGWTIPVEPHARRLLHVERLVPDASGNCPQHDAAAARCRVHRDDGEAALPRSCYHFPRRALIDDRGTFVALSHFCPTAASLLIDTDGPLTIVEGPPRFPAAREYDGLTATGEWPPLLRRDALFDLDSYGLWEQFLVRTIGLASEDTDVVLRRVAANAEQLRRWNVAQGSLLQWTTAVIDSGNVDTSAGLIQMQTGASPSAAPPPDYREYSGLAAYVELRRRIPEGLSVPGLPRDPAAVDCVRVAPYRAQFAAAMNRYVAAKAFGSWTAYQSRDVRTQIAELYLAASVLRVECGRAADRLDRRLDRDVLVEAVRASDLLLMHLADREALVRWLRKAEC
jgi:hypothetical protein